MMVSSVAVLSDIHGVMPALDAVLAEPDLKRADRIVLTGDIAAGPQPTQVLDRLLGLGDKVVWVRGNADRELVELARGEAADVGDAIAPWAAKQLSPDHVDWLAGLPYPVTLTVDGFGEVVFCHATPRDDQEVVVVDSRLERWAEVLGDLPPEVMTVVCGHTHMPFTRLANTRQIINPGSVGMPYGRQGAHWAILSGGAIEMRRTAYDSVAACAQVTESSSYPDVAEWTDYFLHARATDADALAVMAPATAAPSQRPSVDVELVALGVPHGDRVVVDAVLADDPDHGGAERFQPPRLSVDEPAPGLDRIGSPAADRDIEVQPVLERLLLRHHLEPDPRAPPGRIDDAVKAEAELVLAHADGAPVVVPVVIAIRRWLELVAKRSHPEPRERFRIRAVDHQLKLSSHDHSQRWAFSSFSEPGLIGSTQNSRPAGSRITHQVCTFCTRSAPSRSSRATSASRSSV